MGDGPVHVIDNGSGFTIGGYAYQELPSVACPTMLGYPTQGDWMPDGSPYLVGDETRDQEVNLKYPIERGVVADWDDLTAIWQHCFNKLGENFDDQCPVLMTDAPLTPIQDREKMAEILFEIFSVPFFCVKDQAVLSMYHTGHTEGLVLDCGHGVTHVVPIHKRKVLQDGILRMELAGRDLTDYLMKRLSDKGFSSSNSGDKDIVNNNSKHSDCYVALDYEEELKTGPKEPSNGGDLVGLGEERFKCPEALFKPSLLDIDSPGIHELCYNSIQSCDESIQPDLYSHIVLAGGSTLFPGFADRLEKEIRALAPPGVEVTFSVMDGREYSAWFGGSKFISPSSFQDDFISKSEYQEDIYLYLIFINIFIVLVCRLLYV